MSDNINFGDEFRNVGITEYPATFPCGTGRYETLNYSVSVTHAIGYMARLLAAGVNFGLRGEYVNPGDIETMLTNLVELRCLQVSHALPANIHSRDIYVPNFFFPFLARIARIERPLMSWRFLPTWNPSYFEEGEDPQSEEDTCQGDDRLNGMVAAVTETALRLKQANIRVSEGLPVQLLSTDDGILRIFETPDGELRAAGGDPAETDLLIRSVIRIGFCQNCFGEARTRYTRVEDYRNSWERIIDCAYPRKT